ncbi:MAG: sulfotransferase [Myxococcales bacterium]|nr:sulfotransferase [Myxococcales bacterium]
MLHIACTSYSGSTLLGYLLGSHGEFTATSQLAHLPRLAQANAKCTCGAALGACTFWHAVAEQHSGLKLIGKDSLTWWAAQALDPQSPGSKTDKARAALGLWGPRYGADHRFSAARGTAFDRHLRACAAAHVAVAAAVAQVAGTRWVADASKDRWLSLTLGRLAAPNVKSVVLVRDGRAVMASRMRRLGESAGQAAKMWLTHNLWLMRQQQLVGSEGGLRVRYEDLCVDPNHIVGQIRGHLDLPPAPVNPTLNKTAAHLIGGNPMRFETSAQTITLDERWRTDLKAADLRAFGVRARALNRLFGYGD